MTKKIINTGTAANSKNGDSLRTSFTKINENFTELYTALGINADVNLNLGAFEFAGSVLSTTDSTAIVIDQATTISSNLTVGGDLLPSVANGGDLGSSSRPWKSLYVSNNTIFLGGVALSLDTSNNLTVNGSRVGATSYADLTGKPALAAVATSGSYSDLSNKPALFSGSYADLTNKPNLGGTYQFSVAADDSTQRLISTDEVIKFTGAGGITTSSDTEGNITITGSVLTPADGDSVSGSANLVFYTGTWNYTSKVGINPASGMLTLSGTNGAGGITFPDNTIQTTAYTGSVGDLRSDSNINIEINLEDSTLRRWQFGEDGDTVFPNNVAIRSNGAGYRGIYGDPGISLSLVGSGEGSANIIWNDNATSPTQQAVFSGNNYGIGRKAKATITAQGNSNPARTWKFDEDGALTFPDGTSQSTAWTGSTTVSSLVNGANTASLGSDGVLTVPHSIFGNGTSLALSTGATAPGAAVAINTSEVNINFSDARGGFKFKNLGGATGSITFPDATVQTTAATTYTLPTATTSVLGGVKVDGTSVTINGSGVISLNSGLSGTVTFKGGWNASTNTPLIGSLNGTTGWMYIVTVGGTRDLTLGAGPTTYAVNDLVIYDGTDWILVSGNNGVVSFNSRTGAVTLTSTDVTTALGFTPYNSTNPNNYISGITSGNVTTALGYTPLQSSSLSITTNTASGAGSLSYSSGVFTFTPAAAYSLPTATTGALGGVRVDGTTITIASGVIAVSSALTSATQFKGNWDASANTPTLSSSLPTGVAAGWEYIVSVGGTRDIGNGSTVWSVGDLVIYDGAKWVRIPSGNNVVSFNTRQGAITLTSGDVTTALGFTPVTAATQIANKILAGPSTGADAAPTYRALVAADIPSLSYAPTAGSSSITTLGTIATGTWNGSVIAGQYGGTGVANTGKTITLGGNLTTSGAFTTTLTTTAATTLTLPVTGTLATLLGTETLNNKTLGATTIAGHIIPDTDVTYDLGSATYRFRDLYLSGSSIKLGGATLTASGSALTIPASSTLTTPIIATNITTASTTFALVNTTATTVNFASGATTALNIGASTAPITGFASTATTSSTAASIGYLGLPQSATATTATLAIGDAGKHIYVTTAGQTITIPANGTVAYPIGTTITFIAGASATTVLIAITTDTMRLAGGALTGTRTLAANGMATAVKVAATTWYINGVGLT